MRVVEAFEVAEKFWSISMTAATVDWRLTEPSADTCLPTDLADEGVLASQTDVSSCPRHHSRLIEARDTIARQRPEEQLVLARAA